MAARQTQTERQIATALATQRTMFEAELATVKRDWAEQIETAKAKAHIGHWITGAGVVVSVLSLIAMLSLSLRDADRQILAAALQRADNAKSEAKAAIQDQANRCLVVAQLGAQMAAGKAGEDARKALDLAAALDKNCANIRELAAAYMTDRPAQFTAQEVARAKKGLPPAHNPAAVRLTDRFFLGEPKLRGFDIRGVGPRVERIAADDALGGRAYHLGRSAIEIPLGDGAKDLGLAPSAFVDVGQTFILPAPKTDGPRVSVGTGVQWTSPFGPFRIDIARAVLAAPADAPKALAFNVGTQF